MTLPENQWGYHRDWSLSYVKTPVEVLERIVHAVSMGGNMVVNFGPQPDGDFRQEEKDMAQAIGRWMKRYGECVYGCDYAGWDKQDWGYFTARGDSVYMVVFNRPYAGQAVVKVPAGTQLTGAELVGARDGAGELRVVETARNEYNVAMPATDPGEPFAIRLAVQRGAKSGDQYRDALTYVELPTLLRP